MKRYCGEAACVAFNCTAPGSDGKGQHLGETTHLYVEAELLKAFEQSFFIAGHEGLEVRVDG